MTHWTIEDANQIYNVPHWGEGYFAINAQGHVIVTPQRKQQAIDLVELSKAMQAADLRLPTLVRFTDILRDRVQTLTQAFYNAISEFHYQGAFTAVYPIKVNQQRRVVEEILHCRQQLNSQGLPVVGLEAGSKPELMAVLALSNTPNSVIVCNGYKDREYLRLALIGEKLGHQVYIVIEKLSELALVLAEAKQLGVKPRLGVRVRLASIGKGKWQNTGGEKSKFGLNAAQLLEVIHTLKQAQQLDALQLLHFHLGSQIANIRDIQRGMSECARFYVELYRMGACIRCIDVGGGLGVDYEGTRSRSFCSINYSMDEYAKNVVRALAEVCTSQRLPHPHIITESGRAMTAHHAVLITNIIDIETIAATAIHPSETNSTVLQEIERAYTEAKNNSNVRSVVELYHDIDYALSEAQTLYVHGLLSLQQRASAEQLYFATCKLIQGKLQGRNRLHQPLLEELNEKLADKLFVNFSLFQSTPDIWGIDQIFPILPLKGLNQKPEHRCVIQDITCDSDGRIDAYVDGEGIESTLPYARVELKDSPLLGIFLVGAYQEILGDMHNLFGDTDSVDVTINTDGSFTLANAIKGDTVSSVLRYVHFNAEELLSAYQQQITQADLPLATKQQFLSELTAGLSGYTYLED